MVLAALFGFAFGFFGSMPLAGPIAVLVFARGLSRAYRSGAAIAAGSAIAESGYAFLAYWGMSELVSRFPVAVLAAKGVAVAILFGLGVAFVLKKAGTWAGSAGEDQQVRSSFALGLGITALNPTFLATWSAAVAVLHSTRLVPATLVAAFPFALCAGAGIFVWFVLMLALLRRSEGKLRPEWVGWAMRAVGVALLGMGVWAAVDLARALG
ncbi:MAG TPA: LysE family transporter [Myxococcales bacterium]|jgi:threonine/homoserine/homoserine lactone efflux protein